MTAWARFSEPNLGLIGTVTILFARATSSVSSPERSGPKRIAVRPGDAAISFAICSGVITGMLTLRLIDQIGSGQPFNAIAIRRLRLIGWMLIGLNLWYWLREIALPPVLLSAIDPTAGDYRILPTISEGVRGFRNARVDGQFGFGLLAGGALVLLLSEAFRLGATLREENESIL